MAEVFKEHLDWKQTYLAPRALRNQARGIEVVLL